MKIVLINKYESSGGAAIATKRLYEALQKENIDIKLLVQESNSNIQISTTKSFLKKKINFLRFSFERLKILLHIKDRENLFAFDSASFGEDISKHPLVQEADIIHLNWINFGFLSLKSLDKLLKLNKPIVWTLHDMWALTGGCFHSRGCVQYHSECKKCPYLKAKSNLANKVFVKKKEIFSKKTNIYPIAISSWMKDKIQSSKIWNNKNFFEVSNMIDTEFYSPLPKLSSKAKLNWGKDKIHIGFAAFNISNKYKGGEFLTKSIQILAKNNPQISNKIELVAIGKVTNQDVFPKEIPVIFTGYIHEENEMRDIYRAVDLFLMPSLEESLSLVTQEAMACETPVIAFNKGGQVDLIDHKLNGYLAEYKNPKDLATGIEFILKDKKNYQKLSKNARIKIIDKYSYGILAEKISHIYNEILK